MRLSLALALLALTMPMLAPQAAPLTYALADHRGVAFAGPIHLNQYLLDGARPVLDVKVSNGAEPSILASKHSDTLWIGDTSGAYWSSDHGASWHAMPDPFVETGITDGRALAEDDAGAFYLATTNGPTAPVAVSHDGGKSFAQTQPIVAVDSIADRPWLAARGNGDVVLVVNGDRGEECYHSTDGGLVWTPAVNAAGANAGNLVFDALGRIWFDDGVGLEKYNSACAGAPTNAAHVPSGPALFTQVDVDEASRAYLAEPSPDSRQMVLMEQVPGVGFRSLVVSDPALQSNTFPTISVRNSNEIAVAWYGSETPGDPSSPTFPGSWNVYVARVQGFGTATPTITTTRISTESNHVGGFCMGGVSCDLGTTPGDRDLADYFMIDHGTDGTLHIAYGHDGATSNAEVRYAQLAPLS